MKRRATARDKKSDKSGKPAKLGGAWWSWTLLAFGLAAIGLVVAKLVKPLLPPGPALPAKAGAQAVLAGRAASEPETDRALRDEQLRTAEKLLADYPTNDDVVFLAGLIHNDQGDSERAMKLWTRSLELDATRADANESLGYALLLRDDYEGAEKYFRRALQLDTNSHNARFRLATVLSQQGRLPETVSFLERAGELSPEEYRLMAEACQQLKQFEKARANYEMAILLKPNFAEAFYGLSQTLAQLGDAEKSQRYLETSAAQRKNNEEQARRDRSSFDPLLVTRRSVAQTHTDAGRVYMTLGETRKAEELLLRAAALDPRNLLCRLQLAVLCQQSRRDREALQFYEEVVKLDPNDGLTRLNMGRVCLKLNLLEPAERAFQEVVRLEPNRPEGYVALARLYLQAKRNLAEAERLSGTAADLAPEAPNFALLSQARAMNGDRSGALSAINKAIELQPASGEYTRLREMLLQHQ